MTNTAFESIKGIRFGYSFIGRYRTMKLRYKQEKAMKILERIPKHFWNSLLLYTSRKKMTFIACIADPDSAIWPVIEEAIDFNKTKNLQLKAEL
jgi:hypothetical protein